MSINARYAHTNIVARDWRKLAQFYVDVFGCRIVGAQRDHHGDWVRQLTSVADTHVRGAHLALPGYEGAVRGPTLEIFQYDVEVDGPAPAINRPGLAHLAFEVDDVQAARDAAVAAGADDLGQIVTVPVPGAGTITLNYMTDPEGNIFELQKWT